MPIGAPQPIEAGLRLGNFDSGVAALNDWLRRRAMANQLSGASRTYVICEEQVVVGYCALASGAVNVAAATGRFRRNMPDPVPVAILARLAIDRRHQGQGLGRLLFRDAAMRVVNAADAIGVRGILVHAISDQAAAFYRALGFDASPLDPMTLMVTLDDVRRAVS